jgi:putative transposase
VYCQLKLNLSVKRKQRIAVRSFEKRLVPNKLGGCGSMALMRGGSRHQRLFRTFNVIDDFNREALGIDMVASLPADRMSHYLDKQAKYHACPIKMRLDNGPEFTGKTFIGWAKSMV